MITPVFSRGEDRVLLLRDDFQFKNEQSAFEKILTEQLFLLSFDVNFIGEFVQVSNKLQTYPIKLPYYGDPPEPYYLFGLIGGPTFIKLQSGEQVDDLMSIPEIHRGDRIHTIGRIIMEDKTLSVAIAVSTGTFEPYVILGWGSDTQVVRPAHARLIADDIYYAAKGSEMDSFLYKAMQEVLVDLDGEKREAFMDAFRKHRDDYMGSLQDGQEETNTEEINAPENQIGKGITEIDIEAEADEPLKSEENGDGKDTEEGKLLKEKISEAYTKESTTENKSESKPDSEKSSS